MPKSSRLQSIAGTIVLSYVLICVALAILPVVLDAWQTPFLLCMASGLAYLRLFGFRSRTKEHSTAAERVPFETVDVPYEPEA